MPSAGYGDWRYPPIGVEVDPYDFKQWDEPRNRQDDLVDQFIAHGNDAHTVERAEGATTGDLRMQFADGCVLEVFPNTATPEDDHDEYWRLFPTTPDSAHFVVTAHGVET